MYQLTTTSSITRISDGATIPADPRNAEYREYLAWLAIEGNAPQPVAVPARDIAAEQDALLDAYTGVELRNLTPSGAIRLSQWAAAGNAKALAVAAWLEAHWEDYRTKQAALAAGDVVDLAPASLWKPFSYASIAAEAAGVE